MLPVLLDLKFIKIYTFGVFVVLAFFWGSFLLWKNIRLTSYKEDDIFDGLFLSLLGSVFFGRLLYVALHWEKFGFNILKFLLINGYPGISLLGAIAGGILVLWLFLHTKKIKFREAIDYVVAPLFLALGFGKLGSFFSGVEVGAKTTWPLAMKYVNFDGARHLTALYEAVLFFIGCYLAYQLVFQIRREKLKKGFAFAFFCWYASMVFCIMDPLKAFRTTVYGQSFNAMSALTILLTFSIYLIYYFRGLILKQIGAVSNLVFIYGQKSFKKIHRSANKEAARGESQDSQAS